VSAPLLGVVAAMLFSITFVANSQMGTRGGHWFWAASLRYVFTAILLALWLAPGRRGGVVSDALRLAWKDWRWVMCASACGVLGFYAPLCYVAMELPGWVVAASWQVTVLATPIVLSCVFRKAVNPILFVAGGGAIVGVVMVNASNRSGDWAVGHLWMLALVGLAAFAYPVGNIMLWRRVVDGGGKWKGTVASRASVRVFIMSVASLPMWAILGIWVDPPPPTTADFVRSLVIAIVSGGIATTVFFVAQGRAQRAGTLAAVDATQALEVPFAVVFGGLLGDPWPAPSGWLGMCVTVSCVAWAASCAQSRHGSAT
jgi:drug/metabolite transporter (DMT)-like permease